jgi:hypothetical protein
VCPSVPVCLEVNSVQSTPPVNRLTALSPSPRESLSCTRQLRPCQTGYQAGWGAVAGSRFMFSMAPSSPYGGESRPVRVTPVPPSSRGEGVA